MKTSTPRLMLAVALAACAPLAFAQTTPQTQQHQDATHQTHQGNKVHDKSNPTMREQANQRTADNQMRMERPDAWVLTKVKAQLAASNSVSASDINVDVTDGMVRLTGTVAGTTAKQEAVRIARGTEGVKSVDDSGLRVSANTASDARQIDR